MYIYIVNQGKLGPGPSFSTFRNVDFVYNCNGLNKSLIVTLKALTFKCSSF